MGCTLEIRLTSGFNCSKNARRNLGGFFKRLANHVSSEVGVEGYWPASLKLI